MVSHSPNNPANTPSVPPERDTLVSGTIRIKKKTRVSPVRTLSEPIWFLLGMLMVVASLDSKMERSSCGKNARPQKLFKPTPNAFKVCVGLTTSSIVVVMTTKSALSPLLTWPH